MRDLAPAIGPSAESIVPRRADEQFDRRRRRLRVDQPREQSLGRRPIATRRQATNRDASGIGLTRKVTCVITPACRASR